jgi:hypothetical protein
MDEGSDSRNIGPLPGEIEQHYPGQTIVYDDEGVPIGIEEETERGEALSMGLAFTLVGSVFFFMPLGMMIFILQDAAVGGMFCIIPFFSIFLLVGGGLLFGGLRTLYSGITGNGLTYTVTFEELDEREDEENPANTSFSYTSREELLGRIHQTGPAQEEPLDDVSQEAPESPSGSFWDIDNE